MNPNYQNFQQQKWNQQSRTSLKNKLMIGRIESTDREGKSKIIQQLLKDTKTNL